MVVAGGGVEAAIDVEIGTGSTVMALVELMRVVTGIHVLDGIEIDVVTDATDKADNDAILIDCKGVESYIE